MSQELKPPCLADLQAKLIAAQNCAPLAVPHLIAEALDLLDDIARTHQPEKAAQVAPELAALRETQEALNVTQCPWCGHWGQGYADSERPADYCRHDYELKPWRMFAAASQHGEGHASAASKS